MREKEKDKLKVNYDDPEDVKAAIKDGRLNVGGGMGGAMGGAMSGMSSFGMGGGGLVQMSFVRLKSKDPNTGQDIGEYEARQIFGRWQEMLKTGGVDIKGAVTPEVDHRTGEKFMQYVLTQDDNKVFEARDFILEQPETYNFRTNDRDYWPKGGYDATYDAMATQPPRRVSGKKKKKRGKKGKKQKKTKGKGRKRKRDSTKRKKRDPARAKVELRLRRRLRGGTAVVL